MCNNTKPVRDETNFPLSRDNAVSAVVGVMLMLVVTIIIAAVVAAFASGLGASTSTAPVTSLDISMRAGPAVGISATGNQFVADPECVVLRIVSGDAIPSSDIQIITTYTVPDTFNGVPTVYAGKVIKHTLDGSIGQTDKWIDPSNPIAVFTPTVNGYKLGGSLNSLAPGNGMVGSGAPYFGSCVFNPGFDYWFKDRSAFLGFDTTDYTSYGFQEGAVVHVTILHTPSGQTIYDKDVEVSW